MPPLTMRRDIDIDAKYGILWKFVTPKFTFAYWAEPEDADPADLFEFEEDIEAVRSGALDWFCAMVGVFATATGEVIAYDSLGGCAYKTAASFAEGETRDGYFRDMVRTCIIEAKEALK